MGTCEISFLVLLYLRVQPLARRLETGNLETLSNKVFNPYEAENSSQGRKES